MNNNKYKILVRTDSMSDEVQTIELEGEIVYSYTEATSVMTHYARGNQAPCLTIETITPLEMPKLVSLYAQLSALNIKKLGFQYLNDNGDVLYELSDKDFLEVSLNSGNNRESSTVACALRISFMR